MSQGIRENYKQEKIKDRQSTTDLQMMLLSTAVADDDDDVISQVLAYRHR